jgi:hypothetical protein
MFVGGTDVKKEHFILSGLGFHTCFLIQNSG